MFYIVDSIVVPSTLNRYTVIESTQHYTMPLEIINTLTPAQLEVLWRFLNCESDRLQAHEEWTQCRNADQVPSDSLKARINVKIDEKLHKGMGITKDTIRTHIANICRQFDLHNEEGEQSSHRDKLFKLTIAHLKEIEKLVGLTTTRRHPDTIAGEPQKNFIIYRNLGVNHDWFDDFLYSIELKPPQLGSELLYYGPGLARNWLETSKSDYEVKRRQCFNQCLPELLAKHLIGHTNLIDLGVGDFQMARIIIEYGLEAKTVPLLNYYPLDISYEMIASSLLNKEMDNAKILSQVLNQQGEIVAMNTPFTELFLYKNLFCEECKNIYLLLGNTIGNEFDPIHTLQLIRKSMSEEDILIIEFQLIEDEVISDNELTVKLNEDLQLRKFYKGAFLALGGEDSKIYLSIISSKGDYGSTKYSFVCNFTAKTSLKHPAFEKPIEVKKDSSISVYVVNKFDFKKVKYILDRAGFHILSQKISEFSNNKDKRFLYTVVQRKPV